MKGCLMAAVIFLLVIGSVICNAFYIRHASDTLLETVYALPDVPDPVRTSEAIREIHEAFKRQIPILGITVPYTTIDRVSEALISLESFAKTGDHQQYDVTLDLLVDLIGEIARTERITVENIL